MNFRFPSPSWKIYSQKFCASTLHSGTSVQWFRGSSLPRCSRLCFYPLPQTFCEQVEEGYASETKPRKVAISRVPRWVTNAAVWMARRVAEAPGAQRRVLKFWSNPFFRNQMFFSGAEFWGSTRPIE